MTDSQKLLLVMKYLHMQEYYRHNELQTARHNLDLHQKGDVLAVLDYYKQCCYKEMWDKVFTDLSRLLYNS